MRKKWNLLWIILILFLPACTKGTAEIPTQALSQTPSQPEVIVKSPTVSPIPPTPTPVPLPESTSTPTLEPSSTPTSTPSGIGPSNYPAGVNPLTGLVVSDPSLLERRPMAIKVSNYMRSRVRGHQNGLSVADIVYDSYQNGGLTRFLAIFYGTDAAMVGPIRSARFFDKNIVLMYKSIFAFVGADKRVQERFNWSGLNDFLVGEYPKPSPLAREKGSPLDHAYVNTHELSQFITDKGIDNTRQNVDGMYFEDEIPDGGDPAEHLFVRYSYAAFTRWDYVPGTGRYIRFQDKQNDTDGEVYEPLMDQLTKEQVATDNVVMLLIPHEYYLRSGATEIVDMYFNGSGLAYAARDGIIYEVRWNRPSDVSVPYLTYADGRYFPMKPGTTWFQVIGVTSTISTEGSSWRFTFHIP